MEAFIATRPAILFTSMIVYLDELHKRRNDCITPNVETASRDGNRTFKHLELASVSSMWFTAV